MGMWRYFRVGMSAFPFVRHPDEKKGENKKEKKGKTNQKEEKDTRKKKGDSIDRISSNNILIRVYKDFGSNTQILKAEYEAEERRDRYNNLISINEEYAHNEDTDFLIDDVYREMQVILELKNLPVKEKIELLDRKIKKQEKLLRYLEKFPKLNSIYNYPDEDVKARDYTILKKYIQNHTGEGSYFTIENGARVYSFMACDGYLAPIWHGIDRYTQYPDHTRKIKITVQEDQRMKEEIAEYTRDKQVGSILKWLAVILGILVVANIVLGYYVIQKSAELDQTVAKSAFQCVELTSAMNVQYLSLLEKKVLEPLRPEPEKEIPQEVVELTPDTLG